MSDNSILYDAKLLDTIKNFIEPYFSNSTFQITLTWAQSLDGCIGLQSDKNNMPLILSGKESLILTHFLRSIHSGILVGIGTIRSDNPSLTARFSIGSGQPTPIIIDPNFSIDPNARVFLHPETPILITKSKDQIKDFDIKLNKFSIKPKFLFINKFPFHLPSLFYELNQQFQLNSIMVEGGRTIIDQIIQSDLNHLDIITIAPIFIGKDGVRIALDVTKDEKNNEVEWLNLGKDVVLIRK